MDWAGIKCKVSKVWKQVSIKQRRISRERAAALKAEYGRFSDRARQNKLARQSDGKRFPLR